ncbi:MAG: carboxypeptidase regulatory-like domain-containing protein [Calditrichaceae bacterium]|nr:carboxypeptidase regulatory-like domain-containing protein [Calditrichaceae bacterium]MBN2707478.1 carboxypeptidase regulatory-like domain-containing protein [Calditrichaceae bacterium]RQV95568.1 MAG: carboxypeptidase regulatory-like domain-containing protein [Calditrichota bacterium]
MKKIILILLSALLVFCSSPSGNGGGDDTIAITGTVQLQGKTDHSGVAIGLYKPVVIDTALAAINARYPQIGVILTQETEFDHRKETPVKTALTSADGSFELSGIEKGIYHVVFTADSFSIVYKLNQEFSSGQTLSAVTIKPALYLSGTLNQDLTVENQTIITESNLTIAAGAGLTLGNNVLWLLGDNVLVTVNGSLICNNNTSYINIDALDDGHKWNQMRINTDTDLNKLVVRNSQNGLHYYNCSGLVTNSRFEKHNNQSLLYNNANDKWLKIDKCFMSDNTLSFLFIEGVDSITIDNTVLYNTEKGIDASNTVFSLRNCLLKKMTKGIDHFFSGHAIILFNGFEDQCDGIQMAYKVLDELYPMKWNNFENISSYCLRLNQDLNNLAINYNNFDSNCQGYIINSADSINATYNFWGITSVEKINQKITNGSRGVTMIQPIISERIINAGIK